MPNREKPLSELSREHSKKTRIDYKLGEEPPFDADPFKQFSRWYQNAVDTGMQEPNAMAVATVSAAGAPSIRTLLMKEFDANGFVFFTNYKSRKGGELAANAQAALLFYWAQFHRQVRIEGTVELISADSSDAYFQNRPRGAQLSATVSPQSEVIASREELEARVGELDKRLAGKPIERPAHWGGYCLKPVRFEFWRGRENRLHDRMEYNILPAGAWSIRRLAP